MDENIRKEKLKMWTDQLASLQKDLEALMVKKREAASQGDLSENAAYTMAIEDAETTRVRIEQVKNIIEKLEK